MNYNKFLVLVLIIILPLLLSAQIKTEYRDSFWNTSKSDTLYGTIEYQTKYEGTVIGAGYLITTKYYAYVATSEVGKPFTNSRGVYNGEEVECFMISSGVSKRIYGKYTFKVKQ